ncbi:MAG: MFS transporter, partial [Galactobacter sp.]
MSTTEQAPEAPSGLHMTHGQVLRALTGLLLGMFVTMLANTLVSTSMPKIITDLDGELNQTSYSWVLVATMLATAISTPIWGKLSDLTNRKVLLQISLILFVGASAVAGFSESSMMLIICRVFQGLGAGGMQALSQIVMADILSPRERGKYMGLFAGVMAIATVGGPLIGGWITDAFSWHWNFFLSLPFAVVGVIMLQKTLHLPPVEKQEKARLDWLGTVLLTGGMSLALIWLSLAGTSAQVDSGSKQIEYGSFTTVWMLAVAAVALIVFVFVELKVADPLLDMR